MGCGKNSPRVAKTHIDSAVALMDQVEILGSPSVPPSNITRDDVGSIAYTIKKEGVVIASGSLIKTSVIFDTLQTGGGWKVSDDQPGFNFYWVIPGGTLPSKGTYKADAVITDTNNNKLVVSWTIKASVNE